MRFSALILLLLLSAQPTWAATSDELAQVKKEAEAAQVKKAQLKQAEQKASKELETIQEQLVKAASVLEKNEAAYADGKEKLAKLNAQLAAQNKALIGQKTKLEGLMQVMVRFSKTPPEAMVLMPMENKKRISAAHALSMIAEEAQKESLEIKAKLATLEALKKAVSEHQETLETLKKEAENNRKTFEKNMAERKKIRSQLAKQQQDETKKIEALAKKAKSLENLMTSLRKEEQKPSGSEVVADTSRATASRGKMRSFVAAKNRVRVPVSGTVAERFGEKDGANDTNKGIVINARESAMVIAPYDAEVAYSGTFLNYGKMVILKHSGDYHTLLAGLDRIDVTNGDFLLEGEPIGAMGEGTKQRLYVELRENNQPVDPAKWMRGL